MRIGIDARLYGPKHTGIGRYNVNLIENLLSIDKTNNYVLFGDPAELSKYSSERVKVVKLKTRVYSLAEQLINPIVYSAQHLDLLHVTHFNAPILYSGKLIITVHDLIKHYSTGPETSTLPSWQYGIKHLGYQATVAINVKKAAAVITPTHYWKTELVERYHLSPSKIFVTYEGVDQGLNIVENVDHQILEKYSLSKPFIVYTGNLYPHKNVDTLVNAVSHFNQTHDHQLDLAIVSARDHFSDRFRDKPHVHILGFVPDSDLNQLYHQALCLVQPSFIEGFGLTGLEAMKCGLPVISSSATCLPEVYQDAALYFDPYSFVDLSDKIDALIKDQALRATLIDEGLKQVKLYSWRKTARETLSVYEKVRQT